MKNVLLLILLFFVLYPVSVRAQDNLDASETNAPPVVSSQPIPRFAALRSDKVFVRTGPALRYPIKWVYHRAELPVEIVQEFDTWRKIKDIEGDEGWVHQSLLSPKRSVLVSANEDISLNEEATLTSPVLARLEPRVQASLKTCQAGWCHLDAGGYEGWTEQKNLWGVYAQERFN